MKSFTVLRLKLEDDEATSATLASIGQLCRRARNAGLEDWLLRQRGKPESPRQSQRLVKRKDVDPDSEKSESTKIYHALRAAVPELGTTQCTMLAAALWSNLTAKQDWRRGATEEGRRLRRLHAILDYQDRPPFFTTLEIPLHNAHTTVRFTDTLTVTVNRPTSAIPALTVQVCLGGMPSGYKLLLHRLARGELKLADSKLVERDGIWFWHVPFTFETDPRSEIVAELWPRIPAAEKAKAEADSPRRADPNGNGQHNGKLPPAPAQARAAKHAQRPFRLDLPGGDEWFVGDGDYLKAQTARLIGLRKQIGWRYRNRMGAGHGRRKIDAAVRRRRQQERNMRQEVLRHMIADIVRQCLKANVGTLIYHEPSGPLREHSWFAAAGLTWDWTRFCQDLKNAAARQSIAVTVKMWKRGEAIPEDQADPGTQSASAAGAVASKRFGKARNERCGGAVDD